MDPAERAKYMGIKNVCRVVMGGKPEPPFDAESEKLKNMNNVAWSAIGDTGSTRNDFERSDLEEILRQAEKYPNIAGAILDDFFTNPGNNGGKSARFSLQDVEKMCDELHGFSYIKRCY